MSFKCSSMVKEPLLVKIGTVALMFRWVCPRVDKFFIGMLVFLSKTVTFSPVAHLWPGTHKFCCDFHSILMQRNCLCEIFQSLDSREIAPHILQCLVLSERAPPEKPEACEYVFISFLQFVVICFKMMSTRQ